MVSKGLDRVAVYPRYFDRELSRAQGRRVPARLAVKGPDSAWIETAARRAGLDPELEEAVRDPNVPYEKSGRVLVKKAEPKEKLLQRIAAEMRASQDQRETERRR